MRPTQFDFRAIAIGFWPRHPTSKRKPKHWGWPARTRSRYWNRDNKSSNHSRLGPPIQRNRALSRWECHTACLADDLAPKYRKATA
jgi:hypothetical protein